MGSCVCREGHQESDDQVEEDNGSDNESNNVTVSGTSQYIPNDPLDESKDAVEDYRVSSDTGAAMLISSIIGAIEPLKDESYSDAVYPLKDESYSDDGFSSNSENGYMDNDPVHVDMTDKQYVSVELADSFHPY